LVFAHNGRVCKLKGFAVILAVAFEEFIKIAGNGMGCMVYKLY
jgi:hypothetical protein